MQFGHYNVHLCVMKAPNIKRQYLENWYFSTKCRCHRI